MKTYRVVVPKSKSKKVQATVIIICNDETHRHLISDVSSYTFNLDERYEYIYNRTRKDEFVFNVFAEFSDGQNQSVVPMEVV